MMKGRLLKSTNFGWLDRWFTLDKGTLSCYKSQLDAESKPKSRICTIDLRGCAVTVNPARPMSLDISVPGNQSLCVKALTLEEHSKWLIALVSASGCSFSIAPTSSEKHDKETEKEEKKELSTQDTSKKNGRIWKALAITGGVVAGAAICVVAAPVIIAAAGFGAGGIAAGSIAAGMMSSAAIANGGMIAAGSTVAVLQSIGAVGLGAAGAAAVAGAGGAAGGVLAGGAVGIHHLATKNKSEGDSQSSSDPEGKDDESHDDEGQLDAEKKVDENDNLPSSDSNGNGYESPAGSCEQETKQKEERCDVSSSVIPDEYESPFATF